MNFKLNSFLYPVLFFIGITLVAFLLFPLEKKSKTLVYDYDLHQDVLKPEVNYTPVFMILISTVGICFYYSSLDQQVELSKLRNCRMLMQDKVCRETFAAKRINATCDHDDYWVGENLSLGYIKFARIINLEGVQVFLLYIANDNYNSTKIKQPVLDPILAISTDFVMVEQAYEFIKPSMRQSTVKKLEDAYRISKDPAIPQPIREAAREIAEGNLDQREEYS